MNKKETKKPIRVLQMIASLYYGGSQSMLMNIYKKIDRSRIQFDFIIDHDEYNNYLPLIEELGGKVYKMPSFNGKNIFEIKKAWNDFFVEHPEYKILHSHSRSYASIYIPIAKKHGVKTIIHSHNTSNGKGYASIVKNILQYPLRYQADYFFGCSRNAGEWLFGKKVINGDKFFILNNAIDADKFRFNEKIRESYRQEFNVVDKKVFIQVGEFNNQKNHEFTINLFKEIIRKYDNSILFLVGKGELEDKIKNMIKDAKLENSIVLLGFRDDVNNLLQMADYYVMPSNFEGLSVAAIEAQASGINCLLSDRVSKDVKVSDICGFVPLDINKWLEAISNCKEIRKDTYNDIVKAGFDVNTTAKWLADFYEGLSCE